MCRTHIYISTKSDDSLWKMNSWHNRRK